MRIRKGSSAVDQVLATALSPTEKIVLIALCRRPPEAIVTGAELAAAASIHRVTVVKTLTALRARGLVRLVGPKRWQIEWSELAKGCGLGKASTFGQIGDWRDLQYQLRMLRSKPNRAG